MEEKNRQTEANKRYQEKNREKTRYLNSRSTAKSFIRNKASKEDKIDMVKIIIENIDNQGLQEFQQLINQKLKEL